MFTSLHELAKKATLMITVAAEGDDQLRVNVTPCPADTKAKASLPQPLSLVATPAEFDAEFITALGTWQAPKRTLVQQVQDAVAPAASEAPKLPAPPKQEKGKPGRKPRSDKPAEEQATLSGVDEAGAAAGDAAAAADHVMASDAPQESAAAPNDQVTGIAGADQPPANAPTVDQATPPAATDAEQAPPAAAPTPAEALDPDAVEIKPLEIF
nr:PRTRC system protein E [uncultured Massilia sp.]